MASQSQSQCQQAGKMATGVQCDIHFPPGSIGVLVFHTGSSTPHVDRIVTDKKMVKRIKQQLVKLGGQTPAGVNLANGNMISDVGGGIEQYFWRDFKKLAKISLADPRIGRTGHYFVPMTWLSSSPELVDPVLGEKKLQDALANNLLPPAKKKKRYEELRKYKGEGPEKAFYQQMKIYHEQTNHELILFHSLHILDPNQGEQETDFVLIDRTLGAVVNTEVKSSLNKTHNTLQDAKDQVAKTKKLLEDWFGHLLNSFKFIGMIYTDSVEPGIDICSTCDPFVMVGEADIMNKMIKLGDEMKKMGHTPATSAMDYRDLAKYLMFCVHANKSGAPLPSKMTREVAGRVMKAGSAENIGYWSCWTPSQFGLMMSNSPRFVLFPSSMCTGKTECLVGKAIEKAKNGEKVLVVVCGFRCTTKSLLFYKLKKQMKCHANITMRYLNIAYGDLENMIVKLKAEIQLFPGHHIMVDEMVLPDPQFLSQVAAQIEQIRIKIEQELGLLLWIILAGGKNFDAADFTEANLAAVFKHFHLAMFRIPLRGTRQVTTQSGNNQLCDVYNFKSNIALDLPSNLVDGIPPAFFYYASDTEADVVQAVTRAMEFINKVEGRRGVAVLINGFSAASYSDYIVKGVIASGRATPLLYTAYSSSQQASECEVEKWLEGGEGRCDLVASVDVSRGWEEEVIVVIDSGNSGSVGPENLYLRTISRLIIVKKKI